MDPWDEVKKQAIKVIKEGTGLDASKTLEEPKAAFGEISTTIAFDIAKKEGRNPVEIAKEIAGKIDLKESIFEKIETAGPYINFRIKWPEFAKFVVAGVLREGRNYGKEDYFAGEVLLEFPSVNPNKPWHIGHCRNAVLGDTVAKLLKTVGFRITSMDYIDDLGLQIAKTYWKIQGKKAEGKFDHWLGKMYVQAEQEIKDNPELEKEVRDILVEMEDKRIAREMCESCVKAQYETAFRLGIYHDILVWETDIMSSGLFEKGLSGMIGCDYIRKVEDGKKAGCIIADLSKFKEMKDLLDTDKVLVRGDGTPTYTGKDVAFHMWKVGLVPNPFRFKSFIKQPNGKVALATDIEGDNGIFKAADVLVNVIGSPQAQPQRLVYLTLRAMGYRKWDKIFHLSYEFVRLPEGRMSGRKGLVISTDEVLDEAVDRAIKEIEKKNPDLEGKKDVAEAIGVGAVRFALLKTAPEKEITFEWDRALSFEGESGPYCQYSHARACRILEKAELPKKARFDKLTDKEKELIMLMAKYPNLLKTIVLGMKQEVWGTSLSINLVPEFCCKLAASFNQFYGESPVLKAEADLRDFRLQLVAAFKQVMNNTLNIIGIGPVEKM
jgi:arginyl-tRNA synthetase